MKTEPPIGIGCHITEDKLVIPDPGFEGSFMEDQGFRGEANFNVLAARGTEPAYVICNALVPAEAAAVVELPSWEPVMDGLTLAPIIGWGALPSLAHPSQVTWDVSAEPGFPELYNPTYGWGHSYWLTIDIDGGAPIYDAAVLAGDSGVVTPVNVDYYSGVPVVTTARLYSSNGGTLLHTLTHTLTP